MEDDDPSAEPLLPPALPCPEDLLLGSDAHTIRAIVARRLFGPPMEVDED